MNRSKLRASAVLLVAFAAGLTVGGAVSALASRTVDDPGTRPLSYTERLQLNLDLTVDQRIAVEEILDQHKAAVHEVWRDVEPRYGAVRQSTRAGIMSLLNDTQQDLYREMNARSDSARAVRNQHKHRK